MSSDPIDDEPTNFSKNPKSRGSFIADSGRGKAQADILAVPAFEFPNTPAETREAPNLQIEDQIEQLGTIAAQVFKSNAGVALATPIFYNLFKSISVESSNADGLHQQFSNVLRRFEIQLANQGIAEKRVRLMLYGIAATIDDIILQKDWAFDSKWSQESMISLFFKETWGGERFFILLKEMMNASSSYIKELELYYLCLQFGFEGRYRLARRDTELNQIRDELFHIIREAWGTLPFELSPKWRGVKALNPQTRPLKNLWYWFVVLALLCGVLYIALLNYLNRKTQTAIADLNNLQQTPAITAEQTEIAHEPEPAPPKPSPDDALNGLAMWQNSGQIKITKDKNKIIIATAKELFASASTNLRDPYPTILPQIGKALNKLPGKIEIIGHTDNVPIRSAKFPDNIVLSQARAKAVEDLLATIVTDPKRLSSRGVGDADPAAPNDTAQGRLANRRVDIILTTP